MLSILKSNKNNVYLLLVLVIIYVVTRLPHMFIMPFVMDESIYSVVISEQVGNVSLTPTFLGYSISWKPFLFFSIYSLFPQFSFLPLEVSYRFPSFIFGLFTIFVLFKTLRNIGASTNVAFLTMIAFIVSFVSMYTNAAVLSDTLAFLLICCSLYLYTEKKLPYYRFIIAGICAFLAFFIKSIVVLMIPILVVAYFYQHDRKLLSNPLFLASFVLIPLAFFIHFTMLNSVSLGEEFYLSDIGNRLGFGGGFVKPVSHFIGSIHALLAGTGIWVALSFYGIWKYWEENLCMSVWYTLSIFPLISAYYMPWYFLPVLPAISYFAVLALIRWEGKEKMDTFFAAFFCLAIIATIAMCTMNYFMLYHKHIDEKEAGLILSGKDKVLILGDYAPGIIAYKTLDEKRSGNVKDVGWIMGIPLVFNSTQANEFFYDYHLDKYNVTNGSFSSIFTSKTIFRKDCNITNFDYVVIVGHDDINITGEIIYSSPTISLYLLD